MPTAAEKTTASAAAPVATGDGSPQTFAHALASPSSHGSESHAPSEKEGFSPMNIVIVYGKVPD